MSGQDEMFRYQSAEPERTVSVMRRSGPNLRLDQTVDHMTKGGVPVNPVVLGSIRSQIDSGKYVEDREGLLRELKTDPALYMHFLHSVYHSGGEELKEVDPFDALRTLEEEKLAKIFRVEAGALSVHALNSSNKQQALRLKHSLLSSTAAENIAEQVNLSPGKAYSSALLRQLALNLIAWNYPTVYAKALNRHRAQGTDFIFELQTQLGVSPLQIVSRLLADWNLGSEMREAVLSEPAAGGAKQEGSELGLRDICELSELFAKSHDRINFPEAEAQWREREKEVKKQFGPDFIDRIEREVVKSIKVYETCAPQVFTAPFFALADGNQAELDLPGTLSAQNSYAARCPERLRSLFEEMYAHLERGKVSVDAIRILADQIVPAAGFERGCLYLSSRDGKKLRPALRFGDTAIESYTPLDHTEFHPIVDALVATVPLKWQGRGIRGFGSEIIAGSLGALRHPGVLYVELEPLLNEKHDSNPLLFFHAVRKALLDCLGDAGG